MEKCPFLVYMTATQSTIRFYRRNMCNNIFSKKIMIFFFKNYFLEITKWLIDWKIMIFIKHELDFWIQHRKKLQCVYFRFPSVIFKGVITFIPIFLIEICDVINSKILPGRQNIHFQIANTPFLCSFQRTHSFNLVLKSNFP